MKKRRNRIVETPLEAGIFNALTLGIWSIVDCYKTWQEESQELREIEEEIRLRDAASRPAGDGRKESS